MVHSDLLGLCGMFLLEPALKFHAVLLLLALWLLLWVLLDKVAELGDRIHYFCLNLRLRLSLLRIGFGCCEESLCQSCFTLVLRRALNERLELILFFRASFLTALLVHLLPT